MSLHRFGARAVALTVVLVALAGGGLLQATEASDVTPGPAPGATSTTTSVAPQVAPRVVPTTTVASVVVTTVASVVPTTTCRLERLSRRRPPPMSLRRVFR